MAVYRGQVPQDRHRPHVPPHPNSGGLRGDHAPADAWTKLQCGDSHTEPLTGGKQGHIRAGIGWESREAPSPSR